MKSTGILGQIEKRRLLEVGKPDEQDVRDQIWATWLLCKVNKQLYFLTKKKFPLCSQILSPLFTCLETDMGWVIASAEPPHPPPKNSLIFQPALCFFQVKWQSMITAGSFSIHSPQRCNCKCWNIKKKTSYTSQVAVFIRAWPTGYPRCGGMMVIHIYMNVGAIKAANRIHHHVCDSYAVMLYHSHIWFSGQFDTPRHCAHICHM